MKKIIITIAAITLVACGSKPKTALNTQYTALAGTAEGTTYNIKYLDFLGRDFTKEVSAFFVKFDNSLSIYNPNSIVSKLNKGDTTVTLDKWFIECFNLSKIISQKSGGLLDPTLRSLIAAYGFGGKGSSKSLTQSEVDSMLKFVGYEKVSLVGDKMIKQDPRIELDFNAIAKGFSVDLIGRYMDSMGVTSYLIEVGGEILCKGVNSKGTAWNVAVDTPFEGNYSPGADTKAILSLSGVGLATSGNYRKYAVTDKGEKVVHTIDPRTGKPSIHNLLSATIIAPTCGEADGFATACMVAGLEGAKKIVAKNPELEALFIYSEGEQMKIHATEGMQKLIKPIRKK